MSNILTIHDKKKIVHWVIRQQYTMEKVAQMYGIPLFAVKDYVAYFFATPSEQRAMLPPREYEDMQKKRLPNKFTGYMSELTEDQLLQIKNDELIFDPKGIEDEKFSSNTDTTSFSQRLSFHVPNLDIIKELHPVTNVRKNKRSRS